MKKYIIIFLLSLGVLHAGANIRYTLHYIVATDQFEVGFVSDIPYSAPVFIGGSQATLVFDNAFNPAATNPAFVTSSVSAAIWGPTDRVIGVGGATNGKKFVIFYTGGAPFAGNIVAGTEYALFRFTFGAGANCGANLRLYVNSSDPGDPDGAGGDFTSLLNLGNIPTTDLLSTNTDVTMQNCASLLPVPVKFLSFTAVKSGDDGLLNWKVGNEDANVSGYEVERSLDRINFTAIATVAPKHNGLTENSYNLTDPKLSALKSSGVIYYQVKQLDANGHYVLSDIRTLRVKENAFEISVYPNPAKSFLFVQVDVAQAGTETIVVTDGSGREMSRSEYKATTGLNLQRINTMNLAAGSYILTMHVGDQTKSIPFVKGN